MEAFEYLLMVVVVAVAAAAPLRGEPGDAEGQVIAPFSRQALKENWKVALSLACFFTFIFSVVFILTRLPCCLRGRDGGDGEHKVENADNSNVIKKCPTFNYASVKDLEVGMNNAMDCAVCLTEFEDEDTVKMLPKCAHVFHEHCIDQWLPSRMTCPVCRHNLTSDIHTHHHIPHPVSVLQHHH
ncbi:hypothetical protein Fmac_013951 [Flemingia macrophylla]|uniref:RING-type E3 ubiquitin transferase n=1 Tax=Flemingia macrophylla TaxID=520843 RepID=A0ABD1MAB5_9FABA